MYERMHTYELNTDVLRYTKLAHLEFVTHTRRASKRLHSGTQVLHEYAREHAHKLLHKYMCLHACLSTWSQTCGKSRCHSLVFLFSAKMKCRKLPLQECTTCMHVCMLVCICACKRLCYVCQSLNLWKYVQTCIDIYMHTCTRVLQRCNRSNHDAMALLTRNTSTTCIVCLCMNARPTVR